MLANHVGCGQFFVAGDSLGRRFNAEHDGRGHTLNHDGFSGTLSTRGETEAGSAGTQPARDNLAEASKRRDEGRRDRASSPRVAPPSFSAGSQPATHKVPPSGRAIPCDRTHSRHDFPPVTSMRAMPPKIQVRKAAAMHLHGYSLDNVTSHPPLASVIQPGRAWVSMPGEILNVLQRHSLLQQVRDRRDPEGMG